jgi:hypothetical protein
MLGCLSEEYRDETKAIKLREFNGVWPVIKTPELPENIQWENMGVSKLERRVRKVIVLLIALVIILSAFGGILYMKGLAEQTKFKINNNCPDNVPMNVAFEDQIQQKDYQ